MTNPFFRNKKPAAVMDHLEEVRTSCLSWFVCMGKVRERYSEELLRWHLPIDPDTWKTSSDQEYKTAYGTKPVEGGGSGSELGNMVASHKYGREEAKKVEKSRRRRNRNGKRDNVIFKKLKGNVIKAQ